VACASGFTVVYGSNDDPARAMIVSGTGFASTPDEHLLFSNVLLGRFLRALYVAWPGRPWYDHALAGLGAFAHAVLAYAGIRAVPDRSALVLYAVYLGTSLALATTLQFTMTAFAAAQAGLLLALSLVERPAAGKARSVLVILAVGLAVAGALVRPDAFWLAAGLTLAPAVVLCWRRERGRLAPFATVASTALVLVLAAQSYDRRYYAREPAWDEYREFHGLVHELQDLRRVDEAEDQVGAAMRLAGWSRNDLRLLLSWFYPDEAVFDRDTLRTFLGRLPPVPQRWARGADALARVWRGGLLLIALALTGVVVLSWPSPRYLVALVAAIAAALGALVFLAVWRKLPSHVWMMVVPWPVACALALRPAAFPARASTVRVAAAAALAAAVLFGSASKELRRSAEARQATAQLLASLPQVPRPGGEALLVTWGPTFPLDAAPTFRADWTPPGLRLFSLGWPHRTPAARATLARLGIRNLTHALAWDPRVWLAAPPEVAPMLDRFVRRHASTRVRFLVQADTPSFTVLRGTAATLAPSGEGTEEDVAVPRSVLESVAPHR
jgi:hypothetical protein